MVAEQRDFGTVALPPTVAATRTAMEIGGVVLGVGLLLRAVLVAVPELPRSLSRPIAFAASGADVAPATSASAAIMRAHFRATSIHHRISYLRYFSLCS